MGKKSELKGADRREAVLLLLRREEPAAVLARRYGVSEQTLYRWRDEFLAAGEAALMGAKSGTDRLYIDTRIGDSYSILVRYKKTIRTWSTLGRPGILCDRQLLKGGEGKSIKGEI